MSVDVSVITPVLNEARYLTAVVAAVAAQETDYSFEHILALGPSTDATDTIAQELAKEYPHLVLVANPSGKTPAALNAALSVARGDIIVRVDGHALIEPDYVQQAALILEETGADNVGGVMAATGVSTFERGVASAMRSPLGVGAAAFHVGGEAGPADTVYLGTFRRQALDRVGGFDESMTRAQDWELNYRIRQTGGVVWFDPRLCVVYRPRSSITTLAKQYRDYGRWRREVVRRHRDTLNLRYLAAPVAVIGLVLGLVLIMLGVTLAAPWLALLGAAAWLGYLLILILGAARSKGTLQERGAMMVAMATMHMCWGWGFLTSARQNS